MSKNTEEIIKKLAEQLSINHADSTRVTLLTQVIISLLSTDTGENTLKRFYEDANSVGVSPDIQDLILSWFLSLNTDEISALKSTFITNSQKLN